MPLERVEQLLRDSRTCSIGFAQDGRAYVLPMFFAYDGEHCYFHSHPGLKDDFMEATQQACLVVIHYDSEDEWWSLQAFGPVERLSLSDDIDAAKAALIGVPLPPEPGSYPGGKPKRSEQQVFYWRLTPTHLDGRLSHRA